MFDPLGRSGSHDHSMALRAGPFEEPRQGPFQRHRQQMVKADFGHGRALPT
jgi:hypothetical protein